MLSFESMLLNLIVDTETLSMQSCGRIKGLEQNKNHRTILYPSYEI